MSKETEEALIDLMGMLIMFCSGLALGLYS